MAQGLQILSPVNRGLTLINVTGGATAHPFRVENLGDGTFQIKATTACYLHKSYTAAGSLAITGLNTAFAASDALAAWIEITLASVSLAPTAAELKTGAVMPEPVITEGSPLAQTKYNIPVGRVVADEQPGMPGFDFTLPGPPVTKHHWQQLLREHQMIVNRCLGSMPGVVTVPWQGI